MSFNVDEASSSASVQTDIGMEMPVRHYTAQLEKAGWKRTNEGESGPLAWNSWSFEGEEHEQWQGLFLLVKRQDVENQYILHVRADSSRTGGGFGSFAPMHLDKLGEGAKGQGYVNAMGYLCSSQSSGATERVDTF